MALALGKLRNRDYEYEFSISLNVLVYWKSLTILAKADYSGNRTDFKKKNLIAISFTPEME